MKVIILSLLVTTLPILGNVNTTYTKSAEVKQEMENGVDEETFALDPCFGPGCFILKIED